MSPKKKNKKINIKKKKRIKFLKWTSLIILIVAAITLFLLSDIFNIKEIKVSNSNKVSEEEIILLSGIKTNENMFKFFKLKAIEKIKTNPYIEDVTIHRQLNGIIDIQVTERVATFMLAIAEEQFGYINNQGYILDINNQAIEKPLLTGYQTESIEVGNRLDIVDLKKLNNIIKIVNTAEEKQISDKITKIDFEDNQDILITMESEGKLIHFGNEKNINDKFVKLMAVLEDTAGQNGEIFLKNIDKVYFRKEV